VVQGEATSALHTFHVTTFSGSTIIMRVVDYDGWMKCGWDWDVCAGWGRPEQ
jgi:hypothetical protein